MEQKAEQTQKNEPPFEDRIDEYAITQFGFLGYSGKLPNTVVSLYKEIKKRKDLLYPGRLSPEGFAFISVMADLTDRKIELGKG